ESALLAADLGIEIIGTTLSGYTAARPAVDGPDLELLGELAGALPSTSVLVAEGRVHSIAQAAAARAAGAHAVVGGTATTRPASPPRWFHDAVTSAPRPCPQRRHPSPRTVTATARAPKETPDEGEILDGTVPAPPRPARHRRRPHRRRRRCRRG